MQYNCVNYGDIMPFFRDATQKLAEITYFSTISREFCYINIYSRKIFSQEFEKSQIIANFQEWSDSIYDA